MNATENKIEVGTQVIYVKDGGTRPIQAIVGRVTPTGRFSLLLDDHVVEKIMFKPDGKVLGDKYGFRSSRVYQCSDEKMNELTERYEQIEKYRKERQAEIDRQVEEDRIQSEKETVEVKAAFNGQMLYEQRALPDGCRLYTINMPIKPEYVASKKGYEIVIVRCKDVEGCDWSTGEKKSMVEAHMTFTSGSTHSFASCSGTKHETDEAALWDCAKSLYHRW